MPKSKGPCVFLDRDGCICEEMGYLNHPNRVRLIRGSALAIRRLNEAGILAVGITNQAGVARGYFTEEVLQLVNQRLVDKLADHGAQLDGLYYCPFHPEGKVKAYKKNSPLRKPSPGMIDLAVKEHAIDLKRSYIVGDRLSDILTGRARGLKTVMVLTGYGLGDYAYKRDQWGEQPDQIQPSLFKAVDWILNDLNGR